MSDDPEYTNTVPKRGGWRFDYNDNATRMFGCVTTPCPDHADVVILEWPHLEAMCGFPKVKVEREHVTRGVVQFMQALEGDHLRLFSLQAPLIMVGIGDSERPFVSEELDRIKAALFSRSLLGKATPFDKHHGLMLEFVKIAAQISTLPGDASPGLRMVHEYYDKMRHEVSARVSARHMAGTDTH